MVILSPQPNLYHHFRQPGEHKIHVKKHGKKVNGSPFSVMVQSDSFTTKKRVEPQIDVKDQQNEQQTPHLSTPTGPSAREISFQMHEQVSN